MNEDNQNENRTIKRREIDKLINMMLHQDKSDHEKILIELEENKDREYYS